MNDPAPAGRWAFRLAIGTGAPQATCMNGDWRSVLLGTAGLWLAAAVAVGLARGRGGWVGERDRRSRVALRLAIGTAAQAAHFVEEWRMGFAQRWPERLGLAPWSDGFFVTFNLAWLVVWVVAAFGLARGWRWVAAPVWFFSLAALANGVAHPWLALGAGGYFPGLWTAPLVGLAGVWVGAGLWTVSGRARRDG